MRINIFKTVLLLLCFQVIGCATTLQYTAPHGKDDNFIYKLPTIDVGPCSNCFSDLPAVGGNIFYKDVKVHFGSSERCNVRFLGIIPTGWDGCNSLYPDPKVYSFYLSLKNISNKPILFDAKKIKLIKAGGKIDYNIDKEKIKLNIMPNETASLRVTIGDWNKINKEFHIDLNEALSIDENILITVKRLSSTKYGLIVAN